MSDVVSLTGEIQIGPASVSESAFPSSLTSITLALRAGTQKIASVNDKGVRGVASPSSFGDLRCVGPGEAVTKGTFLYVRVSQPMLLRLTTDDGSGGSVLAVLPADGPLILEIDPTRFLKLLEAQGSGTLEYLVSGAE